MKVEYLKNEKVSIKDIFVGECFIYCNSLYMRVNDSLVTINNKYNYPYPAVDLESNHLVLLAKDTLVKKINAKVVVINDVTEDV